MPDTASRLRDIKTFESLIRYLEEELDWPLTEYSFEELTFEYSPAELGLKDEDSAKVKAIHQLRPLHYDQPWGIFFVEFENKRMPVVVLRRILSHLVLKKRASANRAQAAAWHLDDLLFISAFGDQSADQREIAFAHFHQETGDLPTLRVLGWDGADTPLKLDHVAATLKDRLRWPSDPGDADAWRRQWSPAFRHRLGHVIRTADALAERLALLARGIRVAALTLMDHESERGPLRRLHKAFQTALIHDLSEADFADTYAQTITYGLLTAAISRTEMSEGRYGTALIAENVTDMVPLTNPFLREMLQTFIKAGGRQGGINFDELGIQDVVELLRGDETDLPAILRDFGNRTRGEDPVIHFYEHFLAAYDKRLKIKRGIFYTPQPVVSYIVRSVHELLQTEFGLEDGLASTTTWGEVAARHPSLNVPDGTDPQSPFVVILDPATGTATFLVEVIDVIYRTLTARWQQQGLTKAQQIAAWNDHVPRHLLPRLYGYELMMAPYAIAHMKIGLKLFETGYRFGSDERVRVYLTNALEPASDLGQMKLEGFLPALAHEAQAVNEVKRKLRFTVVIGNPPYAVEGVNKNDWIERLMAAYREEVRQERNIQLLSDDYVKFLRFADWCVSSSKCGVVAMITKNTYLNTTAFRGLRRCLQSSFNHVNVYDLHGKLYGKAPSGEPDFNVFEIRVGVAVLFARRVADGRMCNAFGHSELWGTSDSKLEALSELTFAHTEWVSLPVDTAQWVLEPATRGEEDRIFADEYRQFVPLLDLVLDRRPSAEAQGSRWGSGVKTNRDFLLVAFARGELEARLQLLASADVPTEEVKAELGLEDGRYWNTDRERRKLLSINWKERIFPYLYGPFDERFIAHIPTLIEIGRGGASKRLMRHFQSVRNLGLVLKRRNLDRDYHHVFVTRCTSDINCLGGQTYVIPLVLSDDSPGPLKFVSEAGSAASNFSYTALLTGKLASSGISPADLFSYVYAILHSPAYRSRYGRELRKEFPRIPMPENDDLFVSLSDLGSALVALHLLESPKLDCFITTYTGPNNPKVERVGWSSDTVWLDAAATKKRQPATHGTIGFRGVPEAVWNFHIGGYQVCGKWLKDRKGRVLSAEDIKHYHRIVVALNETIRLMREIDEVIEEHGGWPIK